MNEKKEVTIPVLEEKCSYCNGIGEKRTEGSGAARRCQMCNGSGYLVTDFGEQVLSLMRHNFRPMLEEISG